MFFLAVIFCVHQTQFPVYLLSESISKHMKTNKGLGTWLSGRVLIYPLPGLGFTGGERQTESIVS